MALKIGITGHRMLENPAYTRREMRQVLQAIMEMQNADHFVGYSCIAAGSDTIFAELVLEKKQDLQIIIPFGIEEYRKDFKSHSSAVAAFDNLIEHGNINVLHNDLPVDRETRNQYYLQAGKYIAEQCDYLVAVWDGENSGGTGGTAEIVNYARSIGKPVYIISASKSEISRVFFERDKLALKYKFRYDNLWKSALLLSLLAAVLLAVSVSFPVGRYSKMLAFAEFVALCGSVSLILLIKYSGIKKKRLQYRREAERLRALEKFYHGGLKFEKPDDFTNISDEVRALSEKYAQAPVLSLGFQKRRRKLLEIVEEQVIYHSSGRPEIGSRFLHYFEKLKAFLFWSFASAVALHFAGEVDIVHQPLLHEISLFLCLAIPPVYASAEAFIYFKEYHKVVYDSAKLCGSFKKYQKMILAINEQTPDSSDELNLCANNVLEEMNSENKEWIFFSEIKDTPGPS